MAQILMILALGTVLTNVTQDSPLPWPWHPDLCQAFGCQEPVKQDECGNELYNIQTHLCCWNATHKKVMEKPSPTYECCGFDVYDQKTQECCEDLSIKPKQNCRQNGKKDISCRSGAERCGSLSAAPGGKGKNR